MPLADLLQRTENLRSLTLGDSFSHSFDGVVFPATLRSISVGMNCSFDGASLPSLRSIQYGPVAAKCT
jgi:hypothetical protein